MSKTDVKNEQSLRSFLADLKDNNELLEIDDQVDWNLEIGAIARRLCDIETKGTPTPAVIFNNIKDYPGGRFFTNTLASFRREAIALGMNPESKPTEIVKAFADRINTPIKPVEVDQADAACKENIVTGDDIDLLEMFPTPKWHEKDGHRYIGTYHAIIVKDPETGWTNWSLQRLGIESPNTTGMLIPRNTHCGSIYAKYEKLNKPMPMAVAIGMQPIDNIVAASGFPDQVDEVDMAGALMQEPIKQVRCETNDLMVPANAEIILEGEVLPTERHIEGPLGEYTGYYSDTRTEKPVFHVTCVTHRNNPIEQGSLEGVPVVDDHIMASVAQSGLCLNLLRDVLRIPGIKNVYFPPAATGWHMCIVSADRKGNPGQAQRISSAIWGSKLAATQNMANWVIVVEEDIDISDLNQVIWAVITRCDPERGIHIARRRSAHQLLPAVSTKERTVEHKPSSSVMIDGGFPEEWYVADKESIQPVVDWNGLDSALRTQANEVVNTNLENFKKD